jgi:hypothetical protein
MKNYTIDSKIIYNLKNDIKWSKKQVIFELNNLIDYQNISVNLN